MAGEVNATKVEGSMSLVSTISSSSSAGGSVSAAIATAATAIPTNPSTTVTGGAAVTSTAKPDHHVYNATGYLVEHDELDHSILAGFSDIQTVFLACISTLLPLIVALGIAFGVRHVWRKYRNRRDSSSGLPWYRSVYSRDNTAESLHHRPHSGGTTVQSATRILSAQDLVNGLDRPRYVCETEVMEEVNVATATPVEYTPPGNTNKNANGNIITLTLKNNHLIVETEERAVTMEDNKNRRYQDNGCSFVVEVQPSYQNEGAEAASKGSTDDVAADQQALVHREEIAEDRTSGFENTRLFGSTNTGLSQSDLSISSQGSVNPSYRYGNQMEYDSGHLGYPMYGGSYESDTLSRKLEGGSKWVEFDKSPDTEKTLVSKTCGLEATRDGEESPSMAGKQNNLDVSQGSGGSMDQQDSTDASISTDTVRSNPNLQVNGGIPTEAQQRAASNEVVGGRAAEANKPVITGALLKDDVQEDAFQEQQRKLGNGTLTPEHKDGERVGKKAEMFVPSHKRSGSIPPRLIEESLELELEPKKSLDIYSQIKTSTKSILPGLSPKFELLQNEVSPIEEKES
ncbi:hypothetical protein HZU73_06091 [Apis mellifera caucasica]|uniref:Uncharacterized protein LOC100577045 isoform X1 n=1 Tax=Apis mellifera TaxID=7460 RepID=A0A7M7GIH8_APIME|nr:uncharacterized protein LOC100577045 isoform X1 [Apis mellifera]XP_006558592.1 uncharacterized protein LOC100577045 isoform X1 [Apis mellifera]KAG6798588.1 hypothetical protein HZU73_06091 [Apis mellifera caucasica]KAG9428846.1 hypothetical protein HZU67_09219 [Apis mellifera carnica]|eukprot:XP_003249323.1 uncharacterized protein LOC100577045 isoform X1 [Apis mellifera]